MRRLLLMLAIAAVAALTLATVAWASAHFINNSSTPLTCTPTTTSTTVTCSFKIGGASSSTTPIFVVLIAPSGCGNDPGNPDIQGQRAFTGGPLFADGSGNILRGYGGFPPLTFSGSCPGNQTSFIGTPRRLEVYECTPGQSPQFTFNKRTGQLTQTNTNCTRTDFASV